MLRFIQWFVRQGSKLTKEGIGLIVCCTVFVVGVMSILSAGWAVLFGIAFLVVLFLTLIRL